MERVSAISARARLITRLLALATSAGEPVFCVYAAASMRVFSSLVSASGEGLTCNCCAQIRSEKEMNMRAGITRLRKGFTVSRYLYLKVERRADICRPLRGLNYFAAGCTLCATGNSIDQMAPGRMYMLAR